MDMHKIDAALAQAEAMYTWVDAVKWLRGEVNRLEAERHADETSRAAAAHRAEEGDSELAGEVELLQARVANMRAQLDAYRSEKDRADRLQAQLDAQPQVEAVGWFYNLECGEDIKLASHDYISSNLVPDRETRRRIFIGHPEPITSEVQP